MGMHQGIRRIATVVAASASMGAAEAAAVEFHGYFRSGIGASRGGADQVCFRAPGTEGASGKFRLGNECETYIELAFAEELRDAASKGPRDPYYKANVRWAFVSAGHRDWEPDSPTVDPDTGESEQELTTSLREVYAEAVNAGPGGASFWVGKRFYRRADLHILDYYYIETAGPGAGVENIDAGFGKLHAAILRNVPAGGTGPAQSNVDLRTEIGLGAGKLTPVFIYGASGKRDQSGIGAWEPLSGWQLSLIHSQGKLLGGDNTAVLQYGTGIYGGVAASRESTLSQYGAWGTQNVAKGVDEQLDARRKSSTLRLVDQLVAHPSPALSAAVVLLYQTVDFGGAKDAAGDAVKAKTETTIGTRPVYHVSKTFDVAFELGRTQVENALQVGGEYKAATLDKLTIAPQITRGEGFWGRPQLRLFSTWAKWNDDIKGRVGGPVYAGDTSGWTTGAQVEAWW